MPRLPIPGSDTGKWGEILNDFLLQAHTVDGTLKTDSVTAGQLASGSVVTASLASGAVTTTKLADGSVILDKLDPQLQASLTLADASLQSGQNLSDLENVATARINLGLGDSATRDVGSASGTVAAGDDARLTNARTPLDHAASHGNGGSDELSLDASQIASGTFMPARIATGTASAGFFPLADGLGGVSWESAAREVRHDTAFPFDYMGTATANANEADAVWTITRLEMTDDGSVSKGVAANASWTNRASEVYA